MGFLDGKIVLVSGVGAGLGKEVASAALREGANVALGDLDIGTTEEIAAALDPTGERSLVQKIDLREQDSIKELAQAAVDTWGRLDGVVQVAAYDRGIDKVNDDALENWALAADVNVGGNLRIARATYPHLKKAGGGAIVFIGSVAAVIPSDNPRMTSYGISKGALVTLSHYVAKEYGPDFIRSNVVAPSWKWGPVVEKALADMAAATGTTPEALYDAMVAQFAMPRMATDGDIANAAVFLVSDLAKNITGQTLYVDAGHVLH